MGLHSMLLSTVTGNILVNFHFVEFSGIWVTLCYNEEVYKIINMEQEEQNEQYYIDEETNCLLKSH